MVVPARAKARNAAGAALGGGHVELPLQREDVALEPGQQVEPGADAGVGQLRQVRVQVHQPGHQHPWPEVDRVAPIASSALAG